MRQFVLLAHELAAPDAADLSLDDLPGTGRLDLLSRCVTSALLLSHDIREDVRVHLVADGYVVRFEGADLRRINPDERSTAARIRDAFAAREGAIGAMAATPSPGVSIRRGDFETVLDDLEDVTLLELHDDGRPVVDLDPPENPAFVLSDHRDFTDEEADLLAARADKRVSLGPRILHANQAITVAHNYLDTDGYRDY
ncbi:tRNA (pseudouridine(54)-N(1))-methyltransferase TrmY [Natronomonas salsuginis]|jgi:tRNA (pseudouridine54-N1)-methyltransferase|uniref:tRNA (pseudouridine(54)-N(1))-methyltransferase n=1 Tax=Natronomonas salsuginis TaxID=2217661 RepID=A0A4U5JF55_9EURY|nr:tRNA (pseudouridine(54)-N(1))-methyltransferase TrmY [Natronomonas salsuginis]TKR24649.1 tRNA (pseudouridine(54)-N(1))-methyltransferase TrmY [Natronomonas salsuginis]